MSAGPLIYPMLAHLAWVVALYALLTLVRAPSVWGVGSSSDGSNPYAHLEQRVSANLSNQFEWPLFFYLACLLAILQQQEAEPALLYLSWIFFVGRVVHSSVQILTNNVRLRGMVFTINFIAVLGMFGFVLFSASPGR